MVRQRFCNFLANFAFISILVSASFEVNAACTTPAGDAGQILFQTPDFLFCDGTSWHNLTENTFETLKLGNGTTSYQVTMATPAGVGSYSLVLPNSDGNAGEVLQTDGAGVLSWVSGSSFADNLGNHTATQNINLGGYWLSGDGDNEGIYVDATGNVGIGTNGFLGQKLIVTGSIGVENGYFTRANGVAITAKTTTTAGGNQKATMSLYDGNNNGWALRYQGNDSGSPLYISNVAAGTETTRAFALSSSGNVLIASGVASAVANVKLQVDGTLRVGDGGEACAAAYAGAIRFTGGNLDFCDGTSGWQTISAGGTPGGANTQIQFNNSGAFAGDSNFVWDNTNKRLGIGTASPSEKLEIIGGSLRVNGAGDDEGLYVSNGSNNLAYLKNLFGHGRLQIRSSTNSGSVSLGPNNPTYANYINGGTGLTIGSNNMAMSEMDVAGNLAVGTYATTVAAPANGMIVSGNVGIGISAPTQALDVTGSANVSTSVIVPLVTSATGADLAINPGAATTATSTGRALTISGGPSGTTLGVGGAVTIIGGTGKSGYAGGALTMSAGNAGGNSSGAVTTVKGGAASGTGAGGALMLLGGDAASAGTGGAVTIKGGNGNSGNPGGAINITAGDALALSVNGANVTVTGGAANGTNMNGGNVILMGGAKTGTGSVGNIGVGTASPARLLHVAGPMRLTASTTPTSPAAGDIFIDSAASNALKYYNGSTWVSLTGGGTPGGADTQLQFNDGGAFNGDTGLTWNKTTKALALTSSDASALAVGPNGATNPTLKIDSSTASAVSGLQIKGGASGSGVTLQAISSSANAGVGITSKGNSNVYLNNSSTSGWITLDAALGSSTLNIDYNTTSLWRSSSADSSSSPMFETGYVAGTSLPSGTEAPMIHFNMAGTRRHNTGAIALQRDFRISPTTHSSVAASTFTNAATLAVEGAPIAGSNVTLTNSNAIYVPTVNVDPGTGTVTNSYGLNVAAATGAVNNYAATFNGGNVGIGTTAPARLLHVEGPMRLTASTTPTSPAAGDIFIDSAASNALKYYNGSTWVSLSGGPDNLGNHTATQNIQLGTNWLSGDGGNEGIYVDSSGNVGIGTTTPDSKLTIAAGGIHLNTAQAIRWDGTSAFSAPLVGSQIGNFNGHTYYDEFEGDHIFRNSWYDQTMLLKQDGKVGIGTNAPVGQLDISGGANLTMVLGKDNGGNSRTDATLKVARVGAYPYNNADIPTSIYLAQSDAAGTGSLGLGGGSSYMNAVKDIIFYTDVANTPTGTERMRINSSGNVGIGNTTPGALLDLKAPAALADTSPIMIFKRSTGSTFGYVYGSGGNGMIRMQHEAGSGYVEMGARSAESVINLRNGNLKAITFDNATNYYSLAMNGGSNDLNMNYNGSTRFLFTSAGKLGVGTTTPAADVEFNNGGTFRMKAFPAAGHYMDMKVVDGVSSSIETPAPFIISTHATTPTERLRVTTAGDVGIGTTTPGEKLEVNGNIKAAMFISTSDERLKHDVEEVSGIDELSKLRGVSWKWNSNDMQDMGVIAQEVEKVYPWAVVTDKNTGYKAVKYDGLIAPLIEATKDVYGICMDNSEKLEIHDREIASLKEEVKTLKDQNEILKSYLCAKDPQAPFCK